MMDWYPVLVQVVEDETPESFHCTIRGKQYWLPKSAINPETRCVLGECDVLIEIQWSVASEMGLSHVWKTNCASGRPSYSALQHRHGSEPAGGVVTS